MSEEEKELYDVLIGNGLDKDDAKNIVKEFYENINKKEDSEGLVMSLSTKSDKTVQDILKELDDIGNRIVSTIPFGSDPKDATGFISIAGEKDSFPILTLCVENPITKKSTISTIVFPSKNIYNSIIEKLLVDYSVNFEEYEGD